MIDFIRKLFASKQTERPPEFDTPPDPVEKELHQSDLLAVKEAAIKANEPYAEMIYRFSDPNNPTIGTVYMDWNDKMLANLIRSGYQLKPTDTDIDLIERWYEEVCRNVALAVAEQQAANFPDHDDDDETDESDVDYYDRSLLARQIINTRIDNQLSVSR